MPDPPLFASRYRLDARLGEGGFKSVYRAHDVVLRRDVALAVFRLDLTQASARAEVLHEARALARLGDNPRIVTVFDVGEADGIPYLVTRLMTGGDLLAMLERSPNRRLPPAQAVGIACDVLEALHTAHAEGVVHRDVTPNNIWLDRSRRAVLGDFGIAAGGAAGGSTRLSDAAGKLPYMAPEVMQGQRATPRSDLYSLGCTLFETLTGRPPFVGDPAAIIAQHLTTAPPPVSRFVSDAPPGLDRAVAGLLAKDLNQRPHSAGEAATTVRQALTPPKRPSPPPTPVDTQAPTRPRGRRATERVPPPVAPAPPPTRRKTAAVWWGVAAAGVIVALLIAAILLASPETDEESDSQRSITAAQITGFKVYNNVFDQQEQDFELGESIAACFTITPQGDNSPLAVVVTEGDDTPRDQSDPAILGRSEPIRVEAASSCYPVPLRAQRASARSFTAWI
ncbi:MAG: serine/threonine-protein kinase, partial [Dehalococcoidia bacterium]